MGIDEECTAVVGKLELVAISQGGEALCGQVGDFLVRHINKYASTVAAALDDCPRPEGQVGISIVHLHPGVSAPVPRWIGVYEA